MGLAIVSRFEVFVVAMQSLDREEDGSITPTSDPIPLGWLVAKPVGMPSRPFPRGIGHCSRNPVAAEVV